MHMAEKPLTPQQRAAIEVRDHSVSLAAGAGCGKTFVLTERFITELDSAGARAAAELDQLVAITFTDAAAREMRDRIRGRAFQRLQSATTDGEAAAWQRLMRSMDAARISTIHAFCAALLRQHAVEAGLDPQFEVLDAPAAELLRLETIDDRLRVLLVERNDDVLNYAAARGLDRLRDDLAAFSGPRHGEIVAHWREETSDQLVAEWLKFFEGQAPEIALAELLASGDYRELRNCADADLAATDKLRRHLVELGEALSPEQIRSQGIGPSLETIHTLARVQGVCKEGDWIDPCDFARFKQAAEKMRKLVKASALQRPIDLAAAREAAELGLALVRLAADVGDAIAATKKRRGQLEFDDLLVRARDLLTDERHVAIRQQAVRRTQLVMVDEFQDTNPLQVEIIQAFCGERWRERGLFAVGDFKQSIYRFTGAQPRVSADLRAALTTAGRLSLTTNFRSQPAILEFVNAVFYDAFADYEPLDAERPQVTAKPAVEFLWSPGGQAVDDEDGRAPSDAKPPARRRKGAARNSRAEEARWIARRLAQLLASGEPIVGTTASGEPTARPLQPGDIAILLRSLSDAQVYEEALREAGLDYYLAGGHAFYSQQEIFDVLNLLRAVASSVDEIALAGALRSPLFALSDETLFWLVEQHGSLNAGLLAEDLPTELAPAEAAHVRRAASTLSRLRDEKNRLLVAELLSLAWDLTGYDATLMAEFLGPRKAANLEKLVEQARAVDAASPGDLPAFITQLSEFVVQAPKEALAATEAEGGDVIRIMTIHHAKGLEFPLVVLADLERKRHLGGAEPVLDPDLGPLVPLADREETVGYDLYRWRENVEDLDERKRLLYVAATRAKDYLILSSSIDDIDRPKSDWLQLIDARISLADGTLRGRLPEDYRTPHIRVTTERPPAVAEPASPPHGADLEKLVVKTRELAASGKGALPPEARAIAHDSAARRRFSFSQMTGALAPVHVVEEPSDVAGESTDEFDETVKAVSELTTKAPGSSGGREFGSLVHAILERIDFNRPRDARRLAELLAPQLIGAFPERAADEAASLVERFLQTPLAAELAAASIVRREIEFLLPWPPANRSMPVESASAERVQGSASAGPRSGSSPYLHGFLDCLYQDSAGRWRLVDYKTNRVAASEVSRVAATYELQMLAYRLACEAALGEPLAECSLVLLHPGVTHTLAWDAAAERRGIQQITTAINTLKAPRI